MGYNNEMVSEKSPRGSALPVANGGDAPVKVQLVRYNVTRVRLVQALLPVALILVPVARRTMYPLVICFAALVLAVVLGLLATLRTKRQAVVQECHNGLRFSDETIRREDLRMWRWEGNRARLYLAHGALVLRAMGQWKGLEKVLVTALGPPRTFVRRGSRRARVAASMLLLMGIAWFGIFFAFGSDLAAFGVLAVVGGASALGALSQSVPQTAVSPNRRDLSPN